MTKRTWSNCYYRESYKCPHKKNPDFQDLRMGILPALKGIPLSFDPIALEKRAEKICSQCEMFEERSRL